jgi:hypothetical protein
MANITLASLGQTYRPYPPATFDERYGQWPGLDRQQLEQLMLQQMYPQPGQMVPGEQFVDPLGHRGLRDIGTGYYMLRRL